MLPWHPEFSCMKLLVRDDSRRKEEFHAAFDLAWDSALLLVVEAITAGLTTIWFAGGALVAAIACYAGANLTVQILLFLCVSLVLLIFTRPLAMKYFNKETIQTNANSLIGKKAVVIQEIDNLAQTGQVRINDIEWTARSADDEKIGEGTVVTIEEIRGVKLIVKQNKED